MDSNLHHRNSAKRKRDSSDQGANRKHLSQWPQSSSNVHGNGHIGNATDDYLNSTSNGLNIGQQLTQHLANASPSTHAQTIVANMPRLTVPRPTELPFSSSGSGNDGDRPMDSSFDMAVGSDGDQNHHVQGTPYNIDMYQAESGQDAQATRDHDGGGTKPSVGSDEWHKVRRDNHKEGQSPSKIY